MSETAQQAKDLFLDALNHDEGASRDQFLDSACGEDSELRRRVERLIAAHELPDSILDRTEPLPEDKSLEHAGQMIGPYKILQRIGEGGMGTVYMAEQKQPVKRRVALKVIKAGMDTKQVMARFEAERQALAMMDHPNIAKVLDAGSTDNGRPYFVMELVKGIPITQYCDENRVSTRQRLSLFINVCQAVQHAHQKGIIHRDLKPSNILVAKCDDKPVVKVIDFGVAKAINQELTQQTLFTEFGQVVGTLEYMSPEQSQFNHLDIDTRSDVYSLGVLLYELLAGEPPFDRHRLRTAAFDEVMRIIREEEPPKPSTRLSKLGRNAATVSEKRGTDLKGLGRTIRGDVDLIVMKALAKDRARRYETANGLGVDIRRYLDGEPIEARAPSTAYQLTRFASRNKGLVASTAVVFSACLLLVGVLWVVARREGKHKQDLHELLKENVLLTILRGDISNAENMLASAREKGFSGNWMITLDSFIELSKGNAFDALTMLETLEDSKPRDPVALALSCSANGELSNEDKVFTLLAELKDSEADSFEDHLMVGISLSRWLPSLAIEHLQEAEKLRSKSPVVRLWLETATAWHASTLENPKDAFDRAQEAAEMIESLMTPHGNDPLVIGGYIHAKMIAAQALRRQREFDRAQKFIDDLEPYVHRLKLEPRHDQTIWWVPLYALMRGIEDQDFDDFESADMGRTSVRNYVAAYLAAERLRFGDDNDIDHGIKLYDSMSGRFKTDTSGLRTILEMSRTDANQRKLQITLDLKEQWREKSDSASDSSKYFYYIDWTAFMMLGEFEEANSVAEQLYKAAHERDLFPEEIACADFMRGNQASPSKLLEKCRDSQIYTAYAHWVIGFNMLGKGDRLGAEEQFAAIEETGDFEHGLYWWGRAFHARVRDPNWLPWLKNTSHL